MPPVLNYPGVYIEELPSGVRTITGVPTSIAAFVGRAWKGPLDVPVTVNSYADYDRTFGGLWRDSTMSYAVQQFFANGGGQAIVVRVGNDGGDATKFTAATFTFGTTIFEAANKGSWGMNLKVTVDCTTRDESNANLFNLIVLDDPQAKGDSQKRGGSGAREQFLNVSVDKNDPRFVGTILEQQSNLLRLQKLQTSGSPGAGGPTAADAPVQGGQTKPSGTDGLAITDANVVGTANDAANKGIYALRSTDIFNLLVIPPLTPDTTDNGVGTTWTDAANFAKERRAIVLVDAPANWTLDSSNANYPGKKVGDYSSIERSYAAIYFPRVRLPDPLRAGNLADFAPSGVVAGVIARTDTERGVWKAPAGIDAGLLGVLGLTVNGAAGTLTDKQNGDLNPLGINCLRTFPAVGNVVWGSRTLEGSDVLASQWKYLPVRRLALYIEESLYRGTKWVVFEPNDEPLWAQIRLNVGAFMQDLFRQGAFQGTSPRDTYLVKCDSETTTQDDINRGVVNILVGFAPLKPAEFVVIQIQQLAGQVQA